MNTLIIQGTIETKMHIKLMLGFEIQGTWHVR